MCCKSTGTLKKVSFYAGRSHNLQGFIMHKTFQTLIVQVFITINQKTVICNEPKVLVQWLWIRSWSHTYVYDVGGHKIFSFMKDQMVAMMQLLLLYQCLFRSARRITLKMLWKTMWSTHMLGEEQPVCSVKTIEHPKTQKADQSQSVELSSTPLLPSVASSLEHDVGASIE